MTEQAAAVSHVRVIDAMCLSHFARAERLDILRDLLVDKECWTTRVVLEEVRQGVAAYSALNDVLAADWLKIAQLDTLDEIRCFALWVNRLGSGERDLGEASVFAAAELRLATAVTDDPAAVRVARKYGWLRWLHPRSQKPPTKPSLALTCHPLLSKDSDTQ